MADPASMDDLPDAAATPLPANAVRSSFVPTLVAGAARRRVMLSIGVLLGVFGIQMVVGLIGGIVLGVQIAIEGGSELDVEEMFTSLESAGMRWIFAACELATLAGALLVARRVGFGAVGLRLRGALRSIVLLAPLLLLLPLVFALDPRSELDLAANGDLLGYALGLSALIGLAEELVFRGILVGMLGGSAFPWFAAAWSSILFGGAHVIGLDGQVTAASAVNSVVVGVMLGFPFALVYLRTGSIVGAMLVHFAWDAVVFTAVGFGFSSDVGLVDGAGTVALGLTVAAAYAWWFRTTAFHPGPSSRARPAGRDGSERTDTPDASSVVAP